jgi:FAD/FMN-containing dehydrogenase
MSEPWSPLDTALDGALLLPGDPSYARASRWPVDVGDERLPAAIAVCASSADVGQVLAFCRQNDLPVAVRGGGHCFAGHSRTNGILIDTSAMRQVRVAGATATVGAGVLLGELYDELHAAGRTFAGGCGPTVGIAGLTLGGGLGVLGRSTGATCDALVSAEVVLADGSTVTCDEDHDSDLFWALRGAGLGSFGVVTTLGLQTLPEPVAQAFHLTWNVEDAPALLTAWQDWLPGATVSTAPSLQITAPADPGRPAQAHLLGAAIERPETGGASLDDLVRSVPAPMYVRPLQPAVLRDVKRQLNVVGDAIGSTMGSAPGSRTSARSEFFGAPLPTHVVDRLVETVLADRRTGEARELDFTPMGGAYNRVAPDATAFVHREDQFLLNHSVTLDPPASHASQWLDAVSRVVAGHGTGRAYQNFADPTLRDPLRAYHGSNLERLARIKDDYDPTDMFHHGQSVRGQAVRTD